MIILKKVGGKTSWKKKFGKKNPKIFQNFFSTSIYQTFSVLNPENSGKYREIPEIPEKYQKLLKKSSKKKFERKNSENILYFFFSIKAYLRLRYYQDNTENFGIIELRYRNFFRYSIVLKFRY